MKHILHIISSPMQDDAHSVKLGRAIIRQLSLKYPETEIRERNLIDDTPPYLTGLHISAFLKNQSDQNDAEQAITSYSDLVLKELKQADFIVLGAPMYNYGIHAVLKAFIDQVVRIGHTIKYQADGSRIGLLTGKTVYLAITAGGNYQHTGFNPIQDYIVNYLNSILYYIGVEKVIPLIIEGTVKPGFTVDYADSCSTI